MESTLSQGTSEYNHEYTAIGDEKQFPYYKHLACGAWGLVGAIMIFFLVTAIKDYNPSTTDNLSQDFGAFLDSMSYSPEAPDIVLNNAQELMTNYPNDFQSYLAMAMACKYMNLPDNSSSYLSKARDMGMNDLYSGLLPTNDEFQDTYPEQDFTTVVDGTIWAVPYFYKWAPGQNFSLSAVGYLVRLQNSSLVFVNPVPIANLSLFENVTGQSKPDFMVTQTKNQSYNVLGMVQQQFPDVPLYGVQAQQGYAAAVNITFAGYLTADGSLFLGEFSQNYFNGWGQTFEECVLLHTPTQTAFLTNLLWLNAVSYNKDWTVPGTEKGETGFFMRLYFWSYGSYNNVSVPTYPQSRISDSKAFSQSINNFEKSTFQRILLGLGGTITGEAMSLFKNAFAPYA